MLLTLYQPGFQTGNPQYITNISPGGAGPTQSPVTALQQYNPYLGIGTEEGIYREALDQPVAGIYNVVTPTPQATLVACNTALSGNTGGAAWTIPQIAGAALSKLQFGCVNRRSDVTADPGGFMQVCTEGPFFANCNTSNGAAIGLGTLLTTDGNGNLTAFGGPSAPAAPTFAYNGTSGTTSYTYGLIAVSQNGTYSTMVTAAATGGNATLSGVNSITINAPTPNGDAVGYIVVRTASTGTPSTVGTVGYITLPNTSFTDTGVTPLPGTSATQFFQRNSGLGAPTVTSGGASGTTTWGYQVSAIMPNGVWSVQSASGSTAVGAAVLSTSAYTMITGTNMAGASYYAINRTTAGGTPSSTGIIGYTTSLVTGFRDTGLPSLGTLAQTAQTTPAVTPAAGTCLAVSLGTLAANTSGSTIVPVLLGGF